MLRNEGDFFDNNRKNVQMYSKLENVNKNLLKKSKIEKNGVK